MQATIIPGRCTQTTVAIPPSKSMAHRAIICAALAQGESLIHHVDYSDDILTTIDGMRKLGAHIELEGSDVRVQGIPDFNPVSYTHLDVYKRQYWPLCRSGISTTVWPRH